MKFAKVRDVKSPVRGTPQSAGIDFFIPNDFPTTYVTGGEDILIPSGIVAKIPAGYMLMAENKSGVVTSYSAKTKCGMAIKHPCFPSPVTVGAKIVDSDYQGEIHIHLINNGKQEIKLEPGMKIVQFILVPVSYDSLEETDISELFAEQSVRGAGGFGSTNKQ